MELSEFISVCKTGVELDYFYHTHVIFEDYIERYSNKVTEKDWKKRNDQIKMLSQALTDDEFIWLAHETGGVSGGSCWDESDPQPYLTDEAMPEFIIFYKLLELTVPTIGFLQVKLMEHELIHSMEYTDYEYYGNSTDYSIKYAKVSDIYNWLVEKGFLK